MKNFCYNTKTERIRCISFVLAFMISLVTSVNVFAADDDILYGDPVFSETFGQGWGVWGNFTEAGLSPLASSSYYEYGQDIFNYSNSYRNSGNINGTAYRQFDYFDCSITNNMDFIRSIYPDHKSWLVANFYDHTGDADGRMYIADGATRPGTVFERSVTELCKNAQFEFSCWVAFINSCNNNPPNFQLEIWSKNPNKGINSVMDNMSSDWEKLQFMSNLAVGDKFASADGGSAELLSMLTYEPASDPDPEIGTMHANGDMYIYETGTEANPELHRYLVYYSAQNNKYYCSEDGTVFYNAVENTKSSTYQGTEKFSRGALSDVGGVPTNYYVTDSKGNRHEVYAMSGYTPQGKLATAYTNATGFYYFTDSNGQNYRFLASTSGCTTTLNGALYIFPWMKGRTVYNGSGQACNMADADGNGYYDQYNIDNIDIDFSNALNNFSIYQNDYVTPKVLKDNVTLLNEIDEDGDGVIDGKLYQYLVEDPNTLVYQNSDWSSTYSTYNHQAYFIYSKVTTTKTYGWHQIETTCYDRRRHQYYTCTQWVEGWSETTSEKYYNAKLQLPYNNRVFWGNNYTDLVAGGLTSEFDYEGDLSTAKRWEQIKAHFTLGDQDNVYLILRNFDSNSSGNDFAVDDIEFKPYSPYGLTIDLSNSSVQTACTSGMVTMISEMSLDDDMRAEVEASLKDFGFYFEGYNGENWVSINTTPIQVQSVDDPIELNMSVAEYNSYEKIRAVVRSAVNTNGKCRTLGSEEFSHKDLGETPLFTVTGDDICVDDASTNTNTLKGEFKVINTNNASHSSWRAKVKLSDGSIVTLSPDACD